MMPQKAISVLWMRNMDITQRAARKAAFTLIEVMVVLSILAIIAILAYNFFGSTMKEAKSTQMAAQVFKELTDLSNAFEMYLIDNSSLPVGGLIGVQVQPTDAVMESLKSLPENKRTSNGWVVDNAGYVLSIGGANLTGSPTNDDYLYISGMPYDVCKVFNEKYSGKFGAVVPVWADVAAQRPISVLAYDSGGGHCYALAVVQQN